MRPALQALIATVVAASVLALAAALLLYPIPADFGLVGVAFWTAATLASSASPIRLPRGTLVSVSGSAILAAGALGGPAAAGIVAAIGTTEARELRGEIPWYGSLYNHAVLTLPAILAATIYRVAVGSGAFEPTVQSLAGMVLGGIGYYGLNTLLTVSAVALRERLTIRAVLSGDVRVIASSMLALAPLAWLVADVYATIGWWATLLFALPLASTRGAYKSVVEIRSMFTQTIRALASAVDKKDPYTSNHSKNVQEIAVTIGRQMRCSEAEIEALEWGGLLHDIGKIGVSDAVLLKPERLNKEERIQMNMHPVLGADIIMEVERLKPELPIIRHHHEWYNGSGYPDHLVGEGIPKLARILHVADAFEAMTAARPYRLQPLTREQALLELRRYAGIQFDPVVLDAFARTDYVRDVADPGRPPAAPRPIPLLAQAAAMRAQGGRRDAP
ncbi:MAG: HD-GYP domain-containing protein [Candidatus Limnocylindrales bacterium]